jgi:hypothetical protein
MIDNDNHIMVMTIMIIMISMYMQYLIKNQNDFISLPFIPSNCCGVHWSREHRLESINTQNW